MKMDRLLFQTGLLLATFALLFSVLISKDTFQNVTFLLPSPHRPPLKEPLPLLSGPLRSSKIWDPIPFSHSHLFCANLDRERKDKDKEKKGKEKEKKGKGGLKEERVRSLERKEGQEEEEKEEEEEIPFEEISNEVLHNKLNIGQLLQAEILIPTKFQISPKPPQKVRTACTRKYATKEHLELVSLIEKNYCSHFTINGVDLELDPSVATQEHFKVCRTGLPLGFLASDPSKTVIFNHLDIRFKVKNKKEAQIVQGFVIPSSVSVETASCLSFPNVTCSPFILDRVSASAVAVPFTYQYSFEEISSVPSTSTSNWWGYSWFPLLLLLTQLLLTKRTDERLRGKLSQAQLGRLGSQGASSIRQVKEEVSSTPPFSWILIGLAALGAQLWFSFFAVFELLALKVLVPPFHGSLLAAFIIIFMIGSGVLGQKQGQLEKELKGAETLLLARRNQTPFRKRFSMLTNAISSQIWAFFFFLLLCSWNLLRLISHAKGLVPAGAFYLLICFWISIAIPCAIFGRALGSQSNLKLIDCRILFAFLGLLVLSIIFGCFLHFLACATSLATLHIFTRYILPTKERKIVITPTYIGTTAHIDQSEGISSTLLLLFSGAFPAASSFFGIRQLVLGFATNRSEEISPWVVLVAFLSFTACSLLSASFVVSLMLSKKDHSSISWKGFFAASTSTLYLFVYLLILFATASDPLSSVGNEISILFFILSVSLLNFILSGSLGFFGAQFYLFRLFQAFGEMPVSDPIQI